MIKKILLDISTDDTAQKTAVFTRIEEIAQLLGEEMITLSMENDVISAEIMTDNVEHIKFVFTKLTDIADRVGMEGIELSMKNRTYSAEDRLPAKKLWIF